MTLWIARNKDGTLCIYNGCPERTTRNYIDEFLGYYISEIPSSLFPELTWENSQKN